MKKLLIGALLTLGIGTAMVSCNNGAYDANPNTDYKGAVNPLDTSKNTVLIGSMKGIVNGSILVFSPAYYTVDTNKIRNIYASVRYDSVYFRSITITVADSSVRNKSDIMLTNAVIRYNVYDTVMKKMKEYRTVMPPDTSMRVRITVDKDKSMRGVMDGFMYLALPEPGSYFDYVVFKDMKFYFEER